MHRLARRSWNMPRSSGARVLDDRYGANLQAIAVANDQTIRLAYLSAFVEEAKESGLLQQIIDRPGQRGIQVAPTEIVTHATD